MTSIRNLVALYITVIMLPLCLTVFIFCANFEFDYDKVSEEIALSELRESLLISYDIVVNYDSLSFIYHGKNFGLNFVNNRLLMQPGVQIILNDIDDVFFEERNDCIYVIYYRKDIRHERILCKKDGIYLNDFSNCDDERSDTDNSDEFVYNDSE